MRPDGCPPAAGGYPAASSSARTSSATRSAFEPARLPSEARRLFSKPMRALPPRRIASTRQAVSAGPKAQTAQSGARPATGAAQAAALIS